MITQDGSNAEEGSEEVGNDVEGIVEVDSEEIFVLRGRDTIVT